MNAVPQTLDELRRRSTLLSAPLLGALCLAGAWVIPSLPARTWETSFFTVSGMLFLVAGVVAWRRPQATSKVANVMMLLLATIIEVRLLSIFNGPIFADNDTSLFMLLFAHMPMCYLFCYMIFPSQQALRWCGAICMIFSGTTLAYLLPALVETPDREGARHLLVWTCISSPAFVLLISNLYRFEHVVLRLNTEHDAVSARQELYKHQATHDYLTGLLNRLSFDTELDVIWRQAEHRQQPVALLMIDVDHFKHLNDQHGHRAGDLALQQLSVILSQQVRDRDIVTRYGGEEFAVLLSNTHLSAALRLGERLRAAVANSQLNTDQGRLKCTISVGVACIQPEPGVNQDLLVTEADRALYIAKRRGRNIVVSNHRELNREPQLVAATSNAKQA
jgi:diguanylate cyclase (GGDEF)-like protein